MEEGQELFRQQVIDELSSKLNGEILLKPSISAGRFLLFAFVWLLLMGTAYNFIEIRSSKLITGQLIYQSKNNLVARFMLPIDFVSQVDVGKIIPVQLLGVSEFQRLSISIKISNIDSALSVRGAANQSDAHVANLSVEAELIDSTVLVEGKTFTLSEGIEFSFYLNNQTQKLLPWLLKNLVGGA